MRLPLSELYAMDLSEFFSAHSGWAKLEQMRERANLERARWLGCVMLAPHTERHISPQELMPLPGDEQCSEITEEDFKARREAALNLLKEIGNVEKISLAKDQD